MAFLNRARNVLKQTVSQQVSSKSFVPNLSLFQAIRSMSSSKLFVGGLSYGTDEMSLREAFSKYGEVVEARVILDRDTGRSRGFGFVTYTSTEEASSAIQAFDGQDLHGRRIRVNYATEKPRGGGFGGGFGAGGGFNYGGQGGDYGRGGYQGGGYGGSGGGSYTGGADNYSAGGGYGGSNQYQSGGSGFGGTDNYPTGGGSGFGGANNYPTGGGSGYGVGDSVQGDGSNSGVGTYHFSGSQSGFSSTPEKDTIGLYGEGQGGGIDADNEDFEQDAVTENDRDSDDDPNDYAKRA